MLFLVDNGSVRPPAYKNLVRICERLSARIGRDVFPAPLLHADKIPAGDLEGETPVLLEERIRKGMREGTTHFDILPLFFGPSGALADYLPRRLNKVAREEGKLTVRILDPLFRSNDDGGDLLTDILEESISSAAREAQVNSYAIVLVDHGSPRHEVTHVRDQLSGLLTRRFKDRTVVAASMERRKGEAYDFNEPLLWKALAEVDSRVAIVAQLFLSPGRHAGPGGDIEQICREAEKNNSGFTCYRTKLVGDHPKLLELLDRRWKQRGEIPIKAF